MEHSILGPETGDRRFSQDCDSGSIVVNMMGWLEMVGMVWGGKKVENQVTYFTHVHDLVEDIKQVTGARDVRILRP